MSLVRKLLVASLVAVILVSSGCIKLEEDAEPTDSPTSGNGGGSPARMTADERKADVTEICPGGGLPFPPSATYCARRTIWLSGELEASEFDVTLTTFNGNLDLVSGPKGTWNLTVTLEARASSASEAESRLGDISFEWSHVEGDDHFLTATARNTKNEGSGLSAKMAGRLPGGLLLSYTGTTSNGKITAEGLRTDELILSTSNGEITANADSHNTVLSTSNGEINADLRPWATGAIVLSSSNSKIVLSLHESPLQGHDVEADTSNGEVSINLQDGSLSENRPTSKHFTTTGFDDRSIQTTTSVSTSNGDITIKPA